MLRERTHTVAQLLWDVEGDSIGHDPALQEAIDRADVFWFGLELLPGLLLALEPLARVRPAPRIAGHEGDGWLEAPAWSWCTETAAATAWKLLEWSKTLDGDSRAVA